MRPRILRSTNASRVTKAALFLVFFWTAFDVLRVRRALGWQPGTESATLPVEKIFIASIHWNNGAILKDSWISAVVDFSKRMGRERVYVSVQESGSWDDTKGALRSLDMELEKAGIRRNITLDPTTHLDEISKAPAESGWLWTPRQKMELRRIPYLARLRNEVLEPLRQLQASGEKFDKVLFLNDVVFTSQDIGDLAATRNGQYAAACSLDFSRPPNFYDTFALRDIEGHEAVMQTWPYFRASASRRALKSNSAVPVKSCWNGMGMSSTESLPSPVR